MKSFSLAIIISLIGIISSQSKYWRIVNGNDAPEGKYRFIVSLQISKHNFCGATIINIKWILTAAHCVVDKIKEDISVIYGVYDLNSNDINTEKVNEIIIHKYYSKPNYLDNDIALLKLENYLNVSNCEVMLPSKGFQIPIHINSRVYILGWGRNKTNGVNQSYLQRTKLKLFSRQYCRFRYFGKKFLNSNQMCIGSLNGGKGQCKGDSGGPVLYEYNFQIYQIGIISWSFKPCGSFLYPGVITKVSPYVDWIYKNIKINS